MTDADRDELRRRARAVLRQMDGTGLYSAAQVVDDLLAALDAAERRAGDAEKDFHGAMEWVHELKAEVARFATERDELLDTIRRAILHLSNLERHAANSPDGMDPNYCLDQGFKRYLQSVIHDAAGAGEGPGA